MNPTKALELFAVLILLAGNALAFTTTGISASSQETSVNQPVTITAFISKDSEEVLNTIDLNISTDDNSSFTVSAIDCTPDYVSEQTGYGTGFLYGFGWPDQNYEIRELVSSQLRLESASHSFDAVSQGAYTEYAFQSVSVPNGEQTPVTMHFKNDSNESLESASINTSYRDFEGRLHDFEIFIFNLSVPGIPEFGFFLAPIAVVLLSFFLFRPH